MALDAATIESKISTVVNEATSVADLAVKFAPIAEEVAGDAGLGAEAAEVVSVVTALDKALHEAQSVFKAV
jgi:hypothetical protein